MIGFIGAGKMAEAILSGMLQGGVCAANEVGISDVQGARVQDLVARYGIKAFDGNTQLARACDVVILAVKPQDLDAVMPGIAREVSHRCVISIAAGRVLAGLEAALPEARIIRVMPNLACQVGTGMSVLCGGSRATAEDLACAEAVFGASGLVCQAPEAQFDMVTAVSGSGPAFWTQLAQYEHETAVAAGLTAETARTLVLQTMLGTAKVLLGSGVGFEAFMDAVASKGGTTAAGLAVLRDSPARDILEAVLAAAAERSRALRS